MSSDGTSREPPTGSPNGRADESAGTPPDQSSNGTTDESSVPPARAPRKRTQRYKELKKKGALPKRPILPRTDEGPNTRPPSPMQAPGARGTDLYRPPAHQSIQGGQPSMYAPTQPGIAAAPQSGYHTGPYESSYMIPIQYAPAHTDGYGTPYTGHSKIPQMTTQVPNFSYQAYLDRMQMYQEQEQAQVGWNRAQAQRAEAEQAQARQLALQQRPEQTAVQRRVELSSIRLDQEREQERVAEPRSYSPRRHEPHALAAPQPQRMVRFLRLPEIPSNRMGLSSSGSSSDAPLEFKRPHDSEQDPSHGRPEAHGNRSLKRPCKDGALHEAANSALHQADEAAATARNIQSVVAGAVDGGQEVEVEENEGEDEEDDEDADCSSDEDVRAQFFRRQRDDRDEEGPGQGQGQGHTQAPAQDHGNGDCYGEQNEDGNPPADPERFSGQNNQQVLGDNEILQQHSLPQVSSNSSSLPSPSSPEQSPPSPSPSHSPFPSTQIPTLRSTLSQPPPCTLPTLKESTTEPAHTIPFLPYEPLIWNSIRPIERSRYPARDITNAYKRGREAIAEIDWQKNKMRFISGIEGPMERRRGCVWVRR
ncbi:hypothetical protein M438DRAFT_408727 [Aureobasidium pullulans EXF-150]|uniref:Uncharacterized protein n=1 Tax=Aureobasidium pullulans EXF-150 TaxID=1043002 RepID=A0A074X9C7_AURPU|nr:uncharacterized protein M438DRAFT_408727 [Aureobasidium pullulans EXF-150]KEQ80344.1 hypothetical protein M438DRAFT_408727 [Aureobasidium pullulans EXF-150]